MADLVKKRQQRAGHKGAATKTLRKIEEAFKKDPIEKEALSVLKITLSEKLDTIKALDTEILDLLDKDDEIATEIEKSDDYKEEIYMVIGRISTAIRDPPPRVLTTGAATSAPAPLSRVRLPKLQLRSFSGDVTKWTSFWQSFEAAVHKNSDLSDVEKFNHLNSLLERSARDAVAGLALTEANYRQAIEILQKRFGSKQQIVNKHIDALLRLESVTTSHSVRDLRHLFDDVSCQVRSLRTLGVESATYGSLLCPVLMNKIPQDLQLIISREVSEADWTIDKILELIEKELTARERIGARHGQPQHRNGERKPPSTPSLIAGQPSTSTCCYCNNSHLPEKCDTVTQIESRKQALRRSGQCFMCLRRGHLARDCRSSSRCQICKGRHHSSICSNTQPSRPTPSSSDPVTIPQSSALTTTHTTLNPSAPVYNPVNTLVTTPALCNSSNTIVLLQTATTKVSNPLDPSLAQNVRIVLDCGSQKSYLAKRVSDHLQLPVNDRQKLSIAAFGSNKRSPKWLDIVQVSVHTKDGSNKEIELYVVPHICDPLTRQDVGQSKFAHLERLDLADVPQDSSLQVDLLIGSDLYWQFVTGETIRGTEGPVAVKTTLGWVLSGPTPPTDPTVSLFATHTLHVGNVSNRELNDTLKLFWDLESMGIQPLSNDPVTDYFTSTVRMVDGRYEVSLPWQESHEPLPDNIALCRRRLQGLLRRLKREPDILREYNAIISEQLNRGIVEVVEDTVDTSERVHYLPHHAVVRRDKATTKVRVVYDASAKSTGPSLNECLHAGPKFNQKILEILLRFRSYTIGLVADIEKAFLMISVSPSDRDSLRFLWTEDPYAEDLKIQKLRFARVVFGVSCSPFLLNATLRHHVEKYRTSHPELVNILTESTYVDDVIFGADTESEAYELYRSSKEVLSHGQFNLRKFVTNTPSLQSSINVQENELSNASPLGTESARAETIYPCSQQMVLGVSWDLVDDQLIFSLESFVETASLLIPTKRNIVSLVGQIYDPLGFLSP